MKVYGSEIVNWTIHNDELFKKSNLVLNKLKTYTSCPNFEEFIAMS